MSTTGASIQLVSRLSQKIIETHGVEPCTPEKPFVTDAPAPNAWREANEEPGRSDD